MTSTLLDLSGKIDSVKVSALIQIKRITSKERIPFFVIGATARDILLEAAHGLASKRATMDVDIAVLVESWDQFEHVKKTLTQCSNFEAAKQIQRIIFEGQLPVDIVPFGELSEANNEILWPPDRNFKMSVMGFEECHRHSISIRLSNNPDLVVRVVTLAGLAILKLISWNDNSERRGRDAPDLFFIIRNYLDAGNQDRLFDEAKNLFDSDGFDYVLASARMLGRDISKIASKSTKETLLEILGREYNRVQGHRIAMGVLQNDAFRQFDYDDVVAHFVSLLKGLNEADDIN